MILEGRRLEKRYGAIHAVAGVDFSIARGEIVGLAGESGCGKTTLGKMLVRLIEPTAGQIIFDGKDITALRGREMAPFRRRLQIVFQDPYGSLNPRQTVESMLKEALLFHRLVEAERAGDRVTELLELVGLRSEIRDKYPHELSGGQRQRVGIARAVSVNPEVIVADEPVSALDVSIRAQVLNLLLELRARLGLAILLVSHDLRVLEFVSDRIAIMYGGRIVETVRAEALHQAQDPYTQRLLAAVPDAAR